MDAHRRSQPILLDGTLHTAFMIKYIIYAVFGFLGMLSGTPTVAALAGVDVARTVAGIIFVSSVAAALSVKLSINSVRWKKVELYSTISVVSFVSVYFVSAVTLAVMGDAARVSSSMLALGLVVLPIWRIVQIIKELRRT